MAVMIRCPNPACGRTGSLADDLVGRAIRCPHCRTKFRASPGAAEPAPSSDSVTAVAAARSGSSDLPPTSGPADTAPPAPVSPLAPVPTQVGRFQIRARLGAGAFGAVYRAHDPQLERDVAVKVPRPETLDSPQRVERFLREARAAARLHHPNIVPVYDGGFDGTHYYIASAFIEGSTLAMARAEVAGNPRRAARIVCDLAEALAYVHGMGVVHRDVKPANVLLDRRGRPFLTDFGLAQLETTQERLTRLTRLGSVLGTPAYMAPEQAAGMPLPASDQYSLGVILYELLTGRVPFAGPPEVVLFNAQHTPPQPPRQLKPSIPAALEAVCLRAMAKRPQDRYADCQQLADALTAWLDPGAAAVGIVPGNPAAAPQPAPVTGWVLPPESPDRGGAPAAFEAAEGPLLRWCREHAVLAVLAVLALLAVVVAVCFLLLPRPGASASDATPKDAPAAAERAARVVLLVGEAADALRKKDFAAARRKVGEARDLEPANAEVRKTADEVERAEAAELARRAALGDYHEAMAEAEKAVAGKRFQEAVQRYDRAIEALAAPALATLPEMAALRDRALEGRAKAAVLEALNKPGRSKKGA